MIIKRMACDRRDCRCINGAGGTTARRASSLTSGSATVGRDRSGDVLGTQLRHPRRRSLSRRLPRPRATLLTGERRILGCRHETDVM
jgi:hypothetical protein